MTVRCGDPSLWRSRDAVVREVDEVIARLPGAEECINFRVLIYKPLRLCLTNARMCSLSGPDLLCIPLRSRDKRGPWVDQDRRRSVCSVAC